ncbi:hypothetical protein IE81DRAFT_348437 [Ceraceosorus guamensis]|uniref:Uncharacterized protein n=1 Tax=Ceraceosorus guamensis TaxID=1522189 RepID=A0A316VVG6_9BASI|nr:hypothetical protein IE81DRAFT_348437 [Ceraceosorus guamensis]PWN41284.1 hypothetical protein IE81DRAFT_348437 [Ceraceosorus guamensis]
MSNSLLSLLNAGRNNGNAASPSGSQSHFSSPKIGAGASDGSTKPSPSNTDRLGSQAAVPQGSNSPSGASKDASSLLAQLLSPSTIPASPTSLTATSSTSATLPTSIQAGQRPSSASSPRGPRASESAASLLALLSSGPSSPGNAKSLVASLEPTPLSPLVPSASASKLPLTTPNPDTDLALPVLKSQQKADPQPTAFDVASPFALLGQSKNIAQTPTETAAKGAVEGLEAFGSQLKAKEAGSEAPSSGPSSKPVNGAAAGEGVVDPTMSASASLESSQMASKQERKPPAEPVRAGEVQSRPLALDHLKQLHSQSSFSLSSTSGAQLLASEAGVTSHVFDVDAVQPLGPNTLHPAKLEVSPIALLSSPFSRPSLLLGHKIAAFGENVLYVMPGKGRARLLHTRTGARALLRLDGLEGVAVQEIAELGWVVKGGARGVETEHATLGVWKVPRDFGLVDGASPTLIQTVNVHVQEASLNMYRRGSPDAPPLHLVPTDTLASPQAALSSENIPASSQIVATSTSVDGKYVCILRQGSNALLSACVTRADWLSANSAHAHEAPHLVLRLPPGLADPDYVGLVGPEAQEVRSIVLGFDGCKRIILVDVKTAKVQLQVKLKGEEWAFSRIHPRGDALYLASAKRASILVLPLRWPESAAADEFVDGGERQREPLRLGELVEYALPQPCISFDIVIAGQSEQLAAAHPGGIHLVNLPALSPYEPVPVLSRPVEDRVATSSTPAVAQPVDVSTSSGIAPDIADMAQTEDCTSATPSIAAQPVPSEDQPAIAASEPDLQPSLGSDDREAPAEDHVAPVSSPGEPNTLPALGAPAEHRDQIHDHSGVGAISKDVANREPTAPDPADLFRAEQPRAQAPKTPPATGAAPRTPKGGTQAAKAKALSSVLAQSTTSPDSSVQAVESSPASTSRKSRKKAAHERAASKGASAGPKEALPASSTSSVATPDKGLARSLRDMEANVAPESSANVTVPDLEALIKEMEQRLLASLERNQNAHKGLTIGPEFVRSVVASLLPQISHIVSESVRMQMNGLLQTFPAEIHHMLLSPQVATQLASSLAQIFFPTFQRLGIDVVTHALTPRLEQITSQLVDTLQADVQAEMTGVRKEVVAQQSDAMLDLQKSVDRMSKNLTLVTDNVQSMVEENAKLRASLDDTRQQLEQSNTTIEQLRRSLSQGVPPQQIHNVTRPNALFSTAVANQRTSSPHTPRRLPTASHSISPQHYYVTSPHQPNLQRDFFHSPAPPNFTTPTPAHQPLDNMEDLLISALSTPNVEEDVSPVTRLLEGLPVPSESLWDQSTSRLRCSNPVILALLHRISTSLDKRGTPSPRIAALWMLALSIAVDHRSADIASYWQATSPAIESAVSGLVRQNTHATEIAINQATLGLLANMALKPRTEDLLNTLKYFEKTFESFAPGSPRASQRPPRIGPMAEESPALAGNDATIQAFHNLSRRDPTILDDLAHILAAQNGSGAQGDLRVALMAAQSARRGESVAPSLL